MFECAPRVLFQVHGEVCGVACDKFSATNIQSWDQDSEISDYLRFRLFECQIFMIFFFFRFPCELNTGAVSVEISKLLIISTMPLVAALSSLITA